jgi:hypothetical protein
VLGIPGDFAEHVFTLVQYMLGALAEIASGRRLFVDTYDRKTKETKVGMMQVTPEVAQWLFRFSSSLTTQFSNYHCLLSSQFKCTVSFIFN